MTNPTPPPSTPGAAEFSAQLEDLRLRLQEIRAEEQELSELPAELVADLETAYEQLRVADIEVRAQQAQIAGLLERQGTLHWQHERMLAMLPVPAVVTDPTGIVMSVNAAAEAALSMRVARILGKPIFALFDDGDRRQLRSLLGGGTPSTQRQLATLVPRKGPLLPVEVMVTTREVEADATWLLLPKGRELPVPVRLPEAMSELASLPSRHRQVQDVLAEAVRVCHQALDVTCEVSIGLGSPQDPRAIAATSQLAQLMDGAQWDAGEGPTATAFERRDVVVSDDLRQDGRWPGLARRVPEGVGAAVVVPIQVGDRLVGSLNVYADRPFDEERVRDTIELLAAALGAVIYELELGDELDRLGEDLQRALSSRAAIEQAKGIIMSQHRCTPEQAFAHLTELSSRQERKLRDVALSIVEQVQQ